MAVDIAPAPGDGGGVSSVGRFAARLHALGADVSAAVRRVTGYASRVRTTGSVGPRERTRLVVSAALDEALLTTFQTLRAPTDFTEFASKLQEADELVVHLEAAGAFDAPADYHHRPGPATFEGTARRVGHVRFQHVTFASPYRPDASVPGAARFEEQTDNHSAHAWVLGHDHAAPWVVCVHGAGMGNPLADIFAFRAGALHRAGFNVAIPVLPHHGPRGAGRFAVAFPTDDPVVNFHGAAQAIADVRAVVATVSAGGEPVVLHGISLGAYVASAVAALDTSVCGVIVGVPVVDLPGLMRTHAPARFTHHPLFETLFTISERLEAMTSSLALPLPTASVRRVWAGRADRLVRPNQVQRLIDRWSVEDAYWYQAGHMGFLGASGVRRYIARALVDAGVATDVRGKIRAVA